MRLLCRLIKILISLSSCTRERIFKKSPGYLFSLQAKNTKLRMERSHFLLQVFEEFVSKDSDHYTMRGNLCEFFLKGVPVLFELFRCLIFEITLHFCCVRLEVSLPRHTTSFSFSTTQVQYTFAEYFKGLFQCFSLNVLRSVFFRGFFLTGVWWTQCPHSFGA